jgi:hypothetical protein
MQYRDRIIGLEYHDASSLTPHPGNWRSHGKEQVEALRGVLGEVGIADTILAYRSERNGGKLTVIDGHLRRDAAPQTWPVLVLDVDDAEADYILATHDPLAAMANADAAALDALLDTVNSGDAAVQAMLAGLAEDAGLYGDGGDGEIAAPAVPCIYDQEQIIDAAFTWFRANGFPYRNLAPHVSMQEINKLLTTEPDNLRNTDTAYHVADTYHPHRFHAAADAMRSPFDAFCDDKLLRRALTNELSDGERRVPSTYFTSLNMVSGTQSCANFRPGFAAYLYRKHCPPNATVLDTSTGYGGRLVGFIGSGLAGHYIGIDPNVDTHNGNLRMAQELGFADKVELFNLPAEDVPHDAVAGRCDFAFTSPPYFRKEHYSDDDTQSWKRYPTGDAWRDGFLVPMMALQYAALKPGCTAIVNIADVTIKSKTYPLADWTIEAGKQAGFDFVRRDEFPMTRRFGAGMKDEVATEPVLVFRKPELSHA